MESREGSRFKRFAAYVAAFALAPAGVAVAVTYAYSPAPPPSPSDPAEGSVNRAALISGVTPTGTAWQLSGGLAPDGDICADLQISTSDAFFGSCGLNPGVLADADICTDLARCSNPILIQAPNVAGNATSLMKSVAGFDPTTGLSFVYGSVTTEVAQVDVYYGAYSSVHLRPVTTPVGRWFAHVVAGAETQTGIVLTAISKEGAALDAKLYSAAPGIDNCRNTDPDQIDKSPIRDCFVDPTSTTVSRNAIVAPRVLAVNKQTGDVVLPLATLTDRTRVVARLQTPQGMTVAKTRRSFRDAGVRSVRMALTRRGRTAFEYGALRCRLVVKFSRGRASVVRRRAVTLRLESAHR